MIYTFMKVKEKLEEIFVRNKFYPLDGITYIYDDLKLNFEKTYDAVIIHKITNTGDRSWNFYEYFENDHLMMIMSDLLNMLNKDRDPLREKLEEDKYSIL